MEICFVTHRYPPMPGGTAAYVASLAEESLRRGVGVTVLGILLAYDSAYWNRSGQGLPVSFFIVTLTFGAYLVTGLAPVRRLVARRSRPARPDRQPAPAGTV